MQASRTCTSAVPPTSISRQQSPSTATKQRSKLRELSHRRKQIPCIVTTVTWPQSNVNSHWHLLGEKQASFRVKKKTNLFIRAKCPNQAITHAGTTECLSFSFCQKVSYSNVYVSDQALLRHACNAWRLRVKQDYCVNTHLRHVAIVTARRVESTPSMVLRSRKRGGRTSDPIPNVEMRPETNTWLEPEIDNPAELQVSMSAIVRKV